MNICNINVVDTFELIPTDSRKSFYRKAIVLIDKNHFQYLKSYNTIVAYKDDKNIVHRTWDNWSMTTGRHIKAFTGLNKAEFSKLTLE